jgi:enediyne biosynthesis protein E7
MARAAMLSRLAGSGRDVLCYTVGGERNILLNHPDHVEHVLAANRANYSKDTAANRYFRTEIADGILTADDDRWRHQRSLLNPAFRDRARLATAAREAITAFVERLDEIADTGHEFNLSAAIAEVTLSITVRTLFGMSPEPFIHQCSALSGALDDANSLLPGADGAGPRDALYRQLRAALSASARGEHGPALCALSGDPQHSGDALYQQLVTLLLAGFETTANSLTWAWILLMQHPDVYEEWQHSLRTSSEFTTAVFDETLRLYPSAWILGRRALGADRVGGVVIPAGATVTISPFLLHRNPKFWDDADSFRPHRFLPGGTRPAHRYAYIPFGAGHRYCIGAAYALDEAAMILDELGRRFTFRSRHVADARPEHKFVLRAPDPLPVIVGRNTP